VNKFDIEGKSAVVTGGARGLGFAICERLLASGAQVAIWDFDEQAASEAAAKLSAGGKTMAVNVDITDANAAAQAAADTQAALGGIDILVNSAGIAGPTHTTWEYPVDDWRQVIEVDLVGTYLCCRAVVPGMRERGYGRIVNIASIAGKEGNPNASAYSAAKAGVIGLTKSLGKELAQENITVNCLTPAVIKTAILDQVSDEFVAYMLSKIPMGRFGLVEEVASMVTWLCSEEASFSTAAVFDISGGRATY
jgi:3-oxoacyl-[acyl-carrier protein] reductase